MKHLSPSVSVLSCCPGEQSGGERSGQTPRVSARLPAGGRRAPLGGRAPLFDQSDAGRAERSLGQTRVPTRSDAGASVSRRAGTQHDAA